MERLPRVASISQSSPMVVGPASPVELTKTAVPTGAIGLPVLRSGKVTLRELQPSDAQALWAFINSTEVTQVSLAATAHGRWLRALHRLDSSAACRRRAGRLRRRRRRIRHSRGSVSVAAARTGLRHRRVGLCHRIGVLGHRRVPDRSGTHDAPCIRRRSAFIVSKPARACTNARGNAALKKIGAVQEGVLRRSFLRDGEYLDQVLWTVLEEDWRQAKVIWGGEVMFN